MRVTTVYALVASVALPTVTGAFYATVRHAENTGRIVAETEVVDRLSREAVRLAEFAHRYAHVPSDRLRRRLDDQLEALRTSVQAVRSDTSYSDQAVAIGALGEQLVESFDDAPQLGRPAQTSRCESCTLLSEVSELNETVRETNRAIFVGARRDAQRIGAMIAATGTALALVLGALWLYVRRSVIRPLRGLSAALKDAGDGDLGQRLEPRGSDELVEIGRAFNLMAEKLSRLTATRAELEVEIEGRKALELDLLNRNARLVEVNAELDKFVYIASHDLRAPLRAIRNIAEWIEEDAGRDLPAETARLFTLLKSRVGRLDALLDALLQYNRLGRLAQPVEPVALDGLTGEIAATTGPDRRFVIAYVGAPVTLDTHRVPLEIVLRNLVDNAIKHHDRDDGRVEVSAEIVDDRCRIRVADDGPGVPQAMKDRVFELFQTLRPRDEVEGSGMGLSIVRKTARLYGSDVRLESPIRDGRGAAFEFCWPVHLEGGSPPYAPAS